MTSTRKIPWRARTAVLVALVAVVFAMVSLVDSGYEMTQMRNAFIAEPGIDTDFDWLGVIPPNGFLSESGPVPVEIQTAADEVAASLPEGASKLEHTLALARHLASGPGRGGGVKSSTVRTYRAIVEEGRGYCSDYTQVLNGLAFAAGIPIREWGLSFDDYSGNGHGFSEIYDPALGKWVFIDSFYSFYVVDAASGVPLSVLELRERLAAGEGADTLAVREIEPRRFGFKSSERALDYYRRGSDAFFLYFGNNALSYDRHPVIATLGPVSRAVEETAGILLGIRPEIRLLRTQTNGRSISRLRFRRNLFAALAVLTALGAIALFVLSRRRALSAA